jgi:hypothetical protein
MAWIEGSTLGHVIRESGPWTYPIVNLTHVLGVSTLFGSILLLDLRLLGLGRRRVPLPALADAAVPAAMAGFIVAALTGAGLLAANATDYVDNPFIYIKFPAIAVGLANVVVLTRSAAWRARRTRDLAPREQRQLALVGAISLGSWLTAVTAGRLIGYW